MRRIPSPVSPIVILTLALLVLLAPLDALAQADEWAEVQRLLNEGKSDEAITAIEMKLVAQPENGLAWYLLASARHARGEYAEAAAANAEAAKYDATVRESALYNRACALSRLGELDQAEIALQEAMAVGFDDYDLLYADSDLAALRVSDRLKVPRKGSYQPFVGQNGVKFGYEVLLPQGFEEGRSYPVVVAFGPGNAGIYSTDWARQYLWGSQAQRQGALVVVAHAPADGWVNHPAHHALNDLLAQLLQEYRVEGGKFHMVGYRGGSTIAATFATMSEEYFQTLTLFGGDPFVRWDDASVGDYPQTPLQFYFGEFDEAARIAAQRDFERFAAHGREIVVIELPGEGPTLPGLWDGKLLTQIEKTIELVK